MAPSVATSNGSTSKRSTLSWRTRFAPGPATSTTLAATSGAGAVPILAGYRLDRISPGLHDFHLPCKRTRRSLTASPTSSRRGRGREVDDLLGALLGMTTPMTFALRSGGNSVEM